MFWALRSVNFFWVLSITFSNLKLVCLPTLVSKCKTCFVHSEGLYALVCLESIEHHFCFWHGDCAWASFDHLHICANCAICFYDVKQVCLGLDIWQHFSNVLQMAECGCIHLIYQGKEQHRAVSFILIFCQCKFQLSCAADRVFNASVEHYRVCFARLSVPVSLTVLVFSTVSAVIWP